MRTRLLFIALFCLAIGLILADGRPALAQDTGPVRVLHLSETGFERAHSVAFSPDGKLVAVGGISGIYIVDASTAERQDLIRTSTWARGVASVPGTNLLAAGLFDDTVKIWDASDHQLLRTLEGAQGWIRSISISKDGRLVAAASDDNTIRIWNVAQGSAVLTLDQNIVGIRAVALSPDGRLVAAALGDKTVRVWSVPDGQVLYALAGHGDWVRCVTFSPDGRVLASAGFDMTVKLWNMSDGQLLRTLAGHTSSVLGVSFSPDGALLASGSTDTTIRLWRVSDGAALQVLPGHTGFVYSVAFSPDGRTLASGASDNTVRLWNVEAWLAMPAPPMPGGPIESTTKDCRVCHHRRGSAAPARVIELSCEGCHAGGIGQAWCTAFPRSMAAQPVEIAYKADGQVPGVPTSDEELAIVIASPGNGETLYVKGDHMAPQFIRGTVLGASSKALQDVRVHLDVVAEGQTLSSLDTTLGPNGAFAFNLAINPRSPAPYTATAGMRQCLRCHGDYQAQAGLPIGIVRLVATATDPDGRHATDERWVRVDSSRDASLPVQVVDSQTGQPISGLSVAASATLYGWRDRFGKGITREDGSALLTLDDPSQAPITYHVSIPTQVVNGLLYSSEPVDVKLQPGVTQGITVTLHASAQQGHVSGTLTGAALSSSIPDIWAIQLPAGPAFQTVPGDRADFHFALPIGTYVITPDLMQSARRGLYAESEEVDLLQSHQAEVTVQLARARSLIGSISDPQGRPLAFAWVQVNGKGTAYPADAASGRFIVPDLPPDITYVTVNAPGFYSNSYHVASDLEVRDVRLVPESGMQALPWGNGQVSVPPQTNASIDGSSIALNNGWLWGNGGSQPITIGVGSTQIEIDSGDFALESAGGEIGWLYLYRGKAVVLFGDAQKPVILQGGQMIALVSSAAPFSMNETVALSLHPPLAQSPIEEHLQPTLGARIQNWLEKAGIGTLQAITFITYFSTLVALIAIPVFALISARRQAGKAAAQERP